MTDFTIDRGTDARLDLVLTDASGAAVNLTDAEIWFTAKRYLSDAYNDALIKKTEVSGITIDDAPGGLCHVTILPADTLALPFYRQTLRYDVKVHTLTHDIVAKGTLTIEPVVTEALAAP